MKEQVHYAVGLDATVDKLMEVAREEGRAEMRAELERENDNRGVSGEMITRADKIAALKREIALRKNVYPLRIKLRKMSQEKADQEIAVMEAILHDYIGPEPSQTAETEREAT